MSDKILFLPEISGNKDLKKRLSRDVTDNHLSHAYVFEGQKGSGKHTIARQVIAAVSCCRRESEGQELFESEPKAPLPCGFCLNCRKILENKSPDVVTVSLEEGRVTMGVDTVRDFIPDMYIAPIELPVKAYIIENADLMTEQAQNALLLSLEEPPEYVMFFLLCENSSMLLETIRSRAPILRTQWLTPDEIEEVLIRTDRRAKNLKNDDPIALKTAVNLSHGSVGRAIELLDPPRRAELLEARKEILDLILLLSQHQKSDAVKALFSFGKTRQEVLEKLSLLQYAVRDLILLKKCDSAPLCFFEDREPAQEISSRYTTSGMFSLYDAIIKAISDLEARSNVRLTLTGMLLDAKLI